MHSRGNLLLIFRPLSPYATTSAPKISTSSTQNFDFEIYLATNLKTTAIVASAMSTDIQPTISSCLLSFKLGTAAVQSCFDNASVSDHCHQHKFSPRRTTVVDTHWLDPAGCIP